MNPPDYTAHVSGMMDYGSRVSGISDHRRKLSDDDYVKIRYLYHYGGYTIREIAKEFGISTKYVKKKLPVAPVKEPEEQAANRFACSGCDYKFSRSGLMAHFEVWTSGGNALSCMMMVPGYGN